MGWLTSCQLLPKARSSLKPLQHLKQTCNKKETCLSYTRQKLPEKREHMFTFEKSGGRVYKNSLCYFCLWKKCQKESKGNCCSKNRAGNYSKRMWKSVEVNYCLLSRSRHWQLWSLQSCQWKPVSPRESSISSRALVSHHITHLLDLMKGTESSVVYFPEPLEQIYFGFWATPGCV